MRRLDLLWFAEAFQNLVLIGAGRRRKTSVRTAGNVSRVTLKGSRHWRIGRISIVTELLCDLSCGLFLARSVERRLLGIGDVDRLIARLGVGSLVLEG